MLPAQFRLLKPKILVFYFVKLRCRGPARENLEFFPRVHGNKLVYDNHYDWSKYFNVANRIDLTRKLSPHAAEYANNAQ